jgi:chromosome partitioning protein
MPKTIAVCNRKGGVGKSTILYHLVRAAHIAGRRVLVIDSDPQGNLSSSLAADDLSENQLSMADVLSPNIRASMRSVIIPTIWAGVDLAPTVETTLDVVAEDLVKEAQGRGRRERRLRSALAEVAADYDLILIDTPPEVGIITVNALIAADGVLAMTMPGKWSADGLARLFVSIDRVRKHFNPTLRILGTLINDIDRRTTHDDHWAKQIEQMLANREPPIPVLEPNLVHAQRIEDAVDYRQGLDELDNDPALSRHFASIFTNYLTTLEGGLT